MKFNLYADTIKSEIDLRKLPSCAPDVIRKLLKRCLDRDVKKRLQWIGEARITLNKVGNEPEITVAASPPHRRWVAWVLASVATTATLAVAFVNFREQAPQPQALQYTLAPPERTRIDNFALSPEGRYFVGRTRRLP